MVSRPIRPVPPAIAIRMKSSLSVTSVRAEANRRLRLPLVPVPVPAEHDELDLRDGDRGDLVEPGERHLAVGAGVGKADVRPPVRLAWHPRRAPDVADRRSDRIPYRAQRGSRVRVAADSLVK